MKEKKDKNKCMCEYTSVHVALVVKVWICAGVVRAKSPAPVRVCARGSGLSKWLLLVDHNALASRYRFDGHQLAIAQHCVETARRPHKNLNAMHVRAARAATHRTHNALGCYYTYLFVLYFCFDRLNGVGGLHVERDCFARKSFDEDLHECCHRARVRALYL